ncbi:hypothetical protein ACIBCN_22785 [Nocardia sp. NPDC051052]|uniref:hypothetical protein n=1 Tax=Nocardia sp. NPDC051052 TaxID=3364322 RepID=UPI0037966103
MNRSTSQALRPTNRLVMFDLNRPRERPTGSASVGAGRNLTRRQRNRLVDEPLYSSTARSPPGSGNRGAILAVERDGAPPARPRLVVTGEVAGGGDVNDVVELDVVRVEPTG